MARSARVFPLTPPRESSREFLTELARAFGGAILFALPILMTMEMWWLGTYLESWRVAVLLAFAVPLLTVLSYYIGFRESFSVTEDAADAFVALAVGFIAAAASLLLFSVIEFGMSADEIISKIAMQTVPASLGAILAAGQLGQGKKQRQERSRGYVAELVYMVVGALYLALNLAPTDEIVLISLQFTPWHALIIMGLSLTIMHAFVYAVEFQGQAERPEDASFWSVFLRFTVVGYAVALLTCLFILWIFGRTSGETPAQVLLMMTVLGLPASIGAAAARLVL